MSWLDKAREEYAAGEVGIDTLLGKAAAFRYTAAAAVVVCLVLAALLLRCALH